MKLMAGCIITINNKLLLLKTKKGKSAIPEDVVNENEVFKLASIRAVKNKTGFSVVPNAMFGVYDALDRNYPQRTIGVYYITHIDLSDDIANKLILEFNNKQSKDYVLELLPVTEITSKDYLYDHKTIIQNYSKLLMLGTQMFKKENTKDKKK